MKVASFKAFNYPKIKNNPDFQAIDPLDSRYFDPEVAQHLSEETRIKYQAYVEYALIHTLAEYDLCPKETVGDLEKAVEAIKAKAVYQEEKKTKHDVKAVVNTLKRLVPARSKPYVHLTATSYDIISTANALQIKNMVDQVISPRLLSLEYILVNLTQKYANTPQIGRTHGQHGVPITFGFALAEYVSRIGKSLDRINDLSQCLESKFSGAVGAYNASAIFIDKPQEFEDKLLAKLGLQPAQHSTQVAPPESMNRLLDELVNISGAMANLGHDMRNLQRSEISEIREVFEDSQTGSSTMAHKRNPINFENVASLHKQVLAQCLAYKQNLVSEHQRDLTDSANARFVNVLLACLASMTSRLEKTMSKIEVDKVSMQRNLELSMGAIAAEPLYLSLSKLGHPSGHEKVKKLAHKAMSKKLRFTDVILEDKEIKDKYWPNIPKAQQKLILNPEEEYIGLSAEKAKNIANFWDKKLLS